MKNKTKSFTEDCPFCERPVIFRKQADYVEHLSKCPLRDSQQEIPSIAQATKVPRRGSLVARAYQKLISFNRPSVRVNREKFAHEWSRIDDYWKGCMIVCPECYRFEYPSDERLRPCSCGSITGWAKALVEGDQRFNFAKKFCAGD